MKKLNLFYISIFCICLFLCPGCGLETLYYLDAPFQRQTNPTVSDSGDAASYTEAYFDFYTNENQKVDENLKYLGTAVYYKIYNSYSTMNSHISSVSSISSSTNSSSAFPRLQSYGYQELGTKDMNGNERNISPLISAESSNQRVVIRLTNYQEPDQSSAEWNEYAYRAKIVINNVEKYVPMRNDSTKSFDFGRKNSSGDYDKPKSGEDDVNYGTASKDDVYYVTLYAVAVGRDNSFTNYYSNVLYLGSVAINASEENN